MDSVRMEDDISIYRRNPFSFRIQKSLISVHFCRNEALVFIMRCDVFNIAV